MKFQSNAVHLRSTRKRGRKASTNRVNNKKELEKMIINAFKTPFNNHISNIADLSWDKDGDLLAAICEKLPIIVLWDSNRRKLSQIDSSFK